MKLGDLLRHVMSAINGNEENIRDRGGIKRGDDEFPVNPYEDGFSVLITRFTLYHKSS